MDPSLAMIDTLEMASYAVELAMERLEHLSPHAPALRHLAHSVSDLVDQADSLLGILLERSADADRITTVESLLNHFEKALEQLEATAYTDLIRPWP